MKQKKIEEKTERAGKREKSAGRGRFRIFLRQISPMILSAFILLSVSFLPHVLFAQDYAGEATDDTSAQTQTTGTATQLPSAGAAQPATNPAQPNLPNSGTAQTTATGPNTLTLQNPIKENSISQLLTDLLSTVIQIGAVVAALMFIYAGFLYLTAQGDETKVKDAHKVFRNTVIGTAILLGAQAVVLILQNTINSVSGSNILGGGTP